MKVFVESELVRTQVLSEGLLSGSARRGDHIRIRAEDFIVRLEVVSDEIDGVQVIGVGIGGESQRDVVPGGKMPVMLR